MDLEGEVRGGGEGSSRGSTTSPLSMLSSSTSEGVVVDQEVAAAVVCQLQAAAAAGAAAMCRQSRSRGNAHRIWQQKRHISIAYIWSMRRLFVVNSRLLVVYQSST